MPHAVNAPGRSCIGRQASASGGLTVVTNMQWFYGATWGRTVRHCDLIPVRQRAAGCAQRAEIINRQLELIEVLRRNAMHPSVAEVHVLVGEAEPIRRFLDHLPWHARFGCKIHLVETHSRPRFSDYVQYMSNVLRNRPVAFTNQDIFLEGIGWEFVPRTLGPNQAYFLSRYHTRQHYDVQHSMAAGSEEGIFNTSMSRSSVGRLVYGDRREPRTCDMTSGRFAVWRRSLCSPSNFGSYDAYVLRFNRELSDAEIDLFNYPQNSWGGENLFLFLVQRALNMHVTNPCMTLRAVHMHCELPTSFGVLKVGDQRLGKRDIILRAQHKLRRMGSAAADMSPDVIGKLALNVTALADPGPSLEA